ncbi:MAG: hypothetical protein QME75_04890 [Deltaproteobacteria bacterium]|nr:hypothetical protein [Deltaproteobacteria bacterium]
MTDHFEGQTEQGKVNREYFEKLLRHLGLSESDLPEPDLPAESKPGDDILCRWLPNTYPDLWETHRLASRLLKYVEENQFALRLGDINGLLKLARGLKSVFWGAMHAAWPQYRMLKLVQLDGTAALAGRKKPEAQEEEQLLGLLRNLFAS